jgi:hypothetical protein
VLRSSMTVRGLRTGLFVAAIAVVPGTGAAQDAPPAGQLTPQQLREEIDRLRTEFETVRDSYGARLTALEERLKGIEAGQPVQPAAAPVTPPGAPPPPPTEVQVPPGAAGAGGPTGQLPFYGGATAASKIFNPDIAVIGNFLGALGENEVNPRPAFEMNEAEASFQAVVDPYARADFFLSFSPEGVEIEEGFLTFSTLPGGLLLKVGKFKEQVGKANTLHAHQLPWVDEPIVLQNLFGSEEGLSDAGVSVSRLINNPWMFLEATGEVYQGTSGVFKSFERSDVSWVGRLRAYRDLTEATNLDVGTSIAYGNNEVGPGFHTRLIGVDATLRYRPLRRAIYRRLLSRSEFFWSHSEQSVADVSAFGFYTSGDYQFARRWFAGVRYDWSERSFDSSLVDKGPSLLLTYWPSEFSQIRGQYRHLRYAEGVSANEFLFQFLFSIGAHGAHTF